MHSKKNEKQQLKADSYVFETNVHFPTDLNLAYDAARKCIVCTARLTKKLNIAGWRKADYLRSQIKGKMLVSSRVSRSGGPDKSQRLAETASNYLNKLQCLAEKTEGSLTQIKALPQLSPRDIEHAQEIQQYLDYLIQHIDLIARRLLGWEVIPHSEKIFSIFEPHTEWINKGKSRPNVELGHRLLITSNQYGVIIDYKVMENRTDSEEVESLLDRLSKREGFENIESLSFDKGFYSKENKEKVASVIPIVVMPKKGKTNKKEKEEQSGKRWKQLRKAHSAVESDINCLEHHGLDRCPDKGLRAYKRYVGYGILAYNLHKIGNKLHGISRGRKKKRAA